MFKNGSDVRNDIKTDQYCESWQDYYRNIILGFKLQTKNPDMIVIHGFHAKQINCLHFNIVSCSFHATEI